MITIQLKVITHRNTECIAVFFGYNTSLQNAIKQVRGIRWSYTQKCWWIPLSKENYHAVVNSVGHLGHIDDGELRKIPGLPVIPETVTPASASVNPFYKKSFDERQDGRIVKATIHQVNCSVLPKMKQHLILKSYSSSTIRTYLNEMHVFLQAIKHHAADDFTTNRIKDYLQYCADTLKLSENTLHSRINALKFYFEQVLKRDRFFWDIPRPKKPQSLPKLLNEDEIRRLFNALINKKHKAMLFTAYSGGLRVSEVVNLKIADIDSKRMQIFVERAKGKKDRYVNLSPVLLDILRSYIKQSKPKPKKYLFESEVTHSAYPTRTVQQIFSNAKHKAGIVKAVGVHSLRHSFATHLLDKGTDIRYIKDILGHFNIKTTERYLHVSKKQLVNIISPFDDLWRGGEVDW